MVNRTSGWRWAVALCVVGATMVPAVAFASEEGDMGGYLWTVMWQGINLALFADLGIWFGRKGLGKVLRDRRTALMADLNEAKRLRQEAQGMLDEYEGKVAALDDERRAILEEYREMGAAESKRIVESAKAQAVKITKDAEQTVAGDVARAKAALEAQVLALAAELTEDVLAKRLSGPRHQALVDQYIKDIETHFEDGSAAL